MAPAGGPASTVAARPGMLRSRGFPPTAASMPATMHPARLALIATRRAWWVLALVVLWAQFVAAIHHHAEPGDATGHRVSACDLCMAQASPAAPPPTGLALPAALPARAIPEPDAGYLAVLRDRPVPHSPRAPPLPRHA